ncbi:uncharacterized protein [Nicotiana sylvestris]|uniref:uncharacterized protein n=1 Tax=Nicotiana sylvestris TaxID=4096 RepID=UPI00388CE46F
MVVGEEVSVGTSTGTTAITIDHHHPLFLQPSDTPGSSLISIQLTGTENYALWNRSMEIGLMGKNLWEEYDALMPCPGCDCPKSKSYLEHFKYQSLLQFLMGLNETYAQPRSQILMMSPVPSVNKAYSMVVSEESQRNLKKSTQALDMGDNTALFTNKGGMTTGNTYKPKRNNLFCDYCNYTGHIRETCYKIHGYPNDFKMRRKAKSFPQRPMVNTATHEGQQYMGKAAEHQYMGKAAANVVSQEGQQMLNSPVGNPTPTLPQLIMFTQEQYDQIFKLINKDTGDNSKYFAGTTKATTLADKTKNKNWIVDSGTTNNMVHIRELLDKINTNNLKYESKVHLPDGTSLDIACIGESRIGECGVIRNDLHNRKVKGIGKELEGLYNMQHQQDKAKAATVQTHAHSKVEEELRVWHERLGHAPDKVVKQIPNMKFKINNDRIRDCTICPLARQGRLRFPKSTNR